MPQEPAPECVVFDVQKPQENGALGGRTLPPLPFQPPVQQLIKLTHPAPATPAQFFQLDVIVHHTLRATISFLISAMALAGFKPFGQVRAQFMMV